MSAIIVQMKKVSAVLIAFVCAAFALCGCGAVAPDRVLHDDDNAIALVTVYATGERGKVAPLLTACGHAYASIRNVSDDTIVLGKGYNLPAGATVTLASWEFDAHAGVWFNIEPTYIDQGWFVKRKSVTRRADSAAIARINQYLIDGETDRWTLFDNCTHFAVGLWNAAAEGSDDIISTKGMLTPSDLEKQVMRFEEREVGRPHESAQPIGYFSGAEFIEFTLVG